jgi:hypothetical protein
MGDRHIIAVLVWAAAGLGVAGPAAAANAPPAIRHQPVLVAVQGQAIAIKATVTDDKKVKSVLLHYSTSKDVAPFGLRMQATGGDVYVCRIPANLLSRAQQVTYYIEATDEADATAESPWYTVSIQAPRAGGGAPAQPEEEGSSWTTPALIVGGVLLAGGGAALILANQSKGHHGDSAADYAGTYVGSVSTSLEFAGQSPTHSTHATTLTIQADGTVASGDLHPGQTLQGTLKGADFSLAATVSESNLVGQVSYAGTVSGDRISGSVGGTVSTPSGTNGTYYGSFYAVKQ